MKSLLKYILLVGIRDRLYIGLFISLIAAFSLSIFLGNTALVEQQEATAAYIAGSSRIILAVGMILFVCLSINRAFENKEVEFIISKSISRQQFILGYLGGFFLAAFLIFIPLSTAIFFIVKADKIGLLIWSTSLLAEIFIIISFATLASLILKNAFSAIMASFAFYLISRLMGMFVLAINLPQNFAQIKNHFLQSFLKFLSMIFPRLDFFAQTSWLNYGIENFDNLKIIFAQALIYSTLLIFMSFRDFRLKQF